MDEPPIAPELALLTIVARELATEAFTLEQIFRRHNLDQTYYDEQIAPNLYFQRVLADYIKEWQAMGSTHKRLAFAAAAALEEKLPVLADRMGSRQSELADAVAAAKLFRELAGIAAPLASAGANAGTPFTISINFGDRKVALEATPVAPSLEPVRSDTEGQSEPVSLLPKPERATNTIPSQPFTPGED